MNLRPDWNTDGQDWPNRETSRFVAAAGLRWHVQSMGNGPVLLLLHGTGAATHSWRELMPRLARRFSVVAPDLPGHGFTEMPRAALLSMVEMGRQLGLLLRTLAVEPAYVVGHSAGAAVAMRMCLDGRIAPRALMSLNGALLAPPGKSTAFFPLAARLIGGLPLVPSLLARTAGDARIDGLLANTGSRIDPAGRRFYARLFRRPGHVAGAFGMMGHWDLAALEPELGRLSPAVTLVAGEADRMILPDAAQAAQRLIPGARVVRLPGLGHLAHEEQPVLVAGLIEEMADAAPA